MSAIVNLEADVVELAVMVSDLRFNVTTYVTPLFQYSFHSIANGEQSGAQHSRIHLRLWSPGLDSKRVRG